MKRIVLLLVCCYSFLLAQSKKETEKFVPAFEFKPNDLYAAFEFRVNAKGLFTLITNYYSTELQENEDDPNSLKGKPRMEIAFSGYQTNVKFDYNKEFSEKKFITENGGKIVLNKEFKNFELKDYRFTTKK